MIGRRRQRGYLLISVVVALFLLAAIAVLMTHGSTLGANAASSELEATRADYVAEAGMQHALWRAANSACMGDLTIPTTVLGSDSYSATITGAASGTSYVLNADQDAWIRNDDPDKNNDSARNHVRFESGKIEQVLTRFDLSTLPKDAQIVSAVAWFYIEAGKEHPEGAITVHEIRADWNETSVTWNSFSGGYRGDPITTVPPQDAGDVWVAINLTGQVQSWVNGQANHGILFDTQAEGVHAEYTGSEDAANPPRLEVVVGSGLSSPVTVKAAATLDSGVSRILTDTAAIAYQPASSTMMQPGASAVDDAWTTSSQTAWNYGAMATLSVQPGDHRAFLRMDLRSQVPTGARVTGATLELWTTQLNTSDTIDVHRVIRPWQEGSCFGNCGPDDGVTWNTYDGDNAWAAPGGDVDTAPTASAAPSTTNAWVSWDITDLAAEWAIDPSVNHGIMLRGNAGSAVFASSDNSDSSLHPRITIEYACECGTPCVTLQGAGRIALIGDDGSPDPDDQLKIALFESWGYDVDFYQDRSSDSINWNNYDLAYVSETAVSSDIAANLANLSIGVVNEEPNQYDDLGLAGNSTEHIGSSIDLVDTSHYITSVFQKGPLPIYTGNMEILTADTPLATDLQVLATFSGASTLAAIDEGGKTTSGSAAGRRVILPLGQHFAAGFDWTNLNRNGLLLIQRSIAWAMDTGGPTIGDVLMVVGNDGNLTAQEQAKRALLESWGYAVNVIDEDDNQSSFDTALAANDVVFVTEDVIASDVNTKLTDATIGVVTEEANLVDDLGLGDGIGWDSGTKITIVNDGHYITYPFGAGTVNILDRNESLAYQTPEPAPGLKLLGRSDSGPGLTAIEAAAELVNGKPAAGRRVLLPWGGDSMDVNSLSADGLIIFRRAIEWAAGAGLSGPIAHWRLDDSAGPTAIDSVGGHDGSLANGPTWTDGTVAGGLDFDGTDDYVDLTSDTELTDIFEGGATVTGWIFPRGWGESDNGRILDKATEVSGDRDGWMIALRGETPALQFAQGFTGTRGFWRSEEDTVELNQWTHFAVVYDASSVANDAEIYLNGVRQSPLVEITPTGTIATDAGIALRMGNYAQDTSRTFDGIIDDVRIYDRMLAAGEIVELATRPPIGPIAHWMLDENTGSTAVDSIGGRVGTLTNGPAWATGALGSAVRLDGSNDRINVPHDNGLNLVSEMTLSAWVNADSLKPFQMVLTKGDNGAPENYWLAMEGNKLNFGFIDGGLYAQYTSSTLTLQAGTWHHVAATFDDAANRVVLYVDGSSETFTSNNTPAPNSQRLIIGSSYYGGETFDGVIDDVRIYDAVLGDEEVGDLAAAGGGGGSDYVERNTVFTVSSSNSWQTLDLSTAGVPANAVVEIAMENASGNREREVGVRSVGGSGPTYDLHEAEGGGVDALTKHVQADASGRIQAFAENRDDVSFRLLGYWTAGDYANTDGLFTSSTSNSWRLHNMTSFGIQPRQVVEFIVQNTNGGQEYRGGVRNVGSGNSQMLDLHEAENGGKDFHSVFVETADNVSAAIEAYAENTGEIEFKPAGMWVTAPGDYVEHDASVNLGRPTSNNTWQTLDLAPFGVPPNAVVQITLANRNTGGERVMGVRSVGSSLDRFIELHEPEGGGEDLVTMHVKADASSRIQWYHSRPADAHRFYLMGWWVLD